MIPLWECQQGIPWEMDALLECTRVMQAALTRRSGMYHTHRYLVPMCLRFIPTLTPAAPFLPTRLPRR